MLAQVVKALVAGLISFWSHVFEGGKVKFGIICDLGVTFNNDWCIFGVRFTQIPPWPRFVFQVVQTQTVTAYYRIPPTLDHHV